MVLRISSADIESVTNIYTKESALYEVKMYELLS